VSWSDDCVTIECYTILPENSSSSYVAKRSSTVTCNKLETFQEPLRTVSLNTLLGDKDDKDCHNDTE